MSLPRAHFGHNPLGLSAFVPLRDTYLNIHESIRGQGEGNSLRRIGWLLLDDDVGETSRIGLELVISRRHSADKKHVGDDIVPLQTQRRIFRYANALKIQ